MDICLWWNGLPGAHHLKDLSSSAIEYWELKEFVDRNGNHSSIHWISLDNERVSIDSSLFLPASRGFCCALEHFSPWTAGSPRMYVT